MSLDMSSENACYVHCNFCNTNLVVSVPCSRMMNIVTVKCGHCASLLSVNVGAALPHCLLPIHHQQLQMKKQSTITPGVTNGSSSSSSSSSSNNMSKFDRLQQSADDRPQLKMSPIRPAEKKQRIPSAYNRFIKEEIQRIKANNPKISHREAFSNASKNWAHFPSMLYRLNIEANKQAKLNNASVQRLL